MSRRSCRFVRCRAGVEGLGFSVLGLGGLKDCALFLGGGLCDPSLLSFEYKVV